MSLNLRGGGEGEEICCGWYVSLSPKPSIRIPHQSSELKLTDDGVEQLRGMLRLRSIRVF